MTALATSLPYDSTDNITYTHQLPPNKPAKLTADPPVSLASMLRTRCWLGDVRLKLARLCRRQQQPPRTHTQCLPPTEHGEPPGRAFCSSAAKTGIFSQKTVVYFGPRDPWMLVLRGHGGSSRVFETLHNKMWTTCPVASRTTLREQQGLVTALTSDTVTQSTFPNKETSLSHLLSCLRLRKLSAEGHTCFFWTKCLH